MIHFGTANTICIEKKGKKKGLRREENEGTAQAREERGKEEREPLAG